MVRQKNLSHPNFASRKIKNISHAMVNCHRIRIIRRTALSQGDVSDSCR